MNGRKCDRMSGDRPDLLVRTVEYPKQTAKAHGPS